MLLSLLLIAGSLSISNTKAFANSPPVSKDISVTPTLGTSLQTFKYTISVADAGNDNVYVTPYIWNYTSESWFSLETKSVLASAAEYKTLRWQSAVFEGMMAGVSKYRFEYNDGTNRGVWGPYEGPDITAKTHSITLNAFADAGVSSSPDNRDKNYGSDGKIWLMNSWYLTDSYMYVMFDFGTFRQLIPKAIVVSAKMKICRYADFSNNNVSTHYCSDNGWKEDSITWNNQPIGSISSLPTDVVTLSSTDEMSGFYYVSTWDITLDVKKAWDDNQSLLTEVLFLETNSSYVIYLTKEEDWRGWYQPTLLIEYSLPTYWINFSLSGIPSETSAMIYLDGTQVGELSAEESKRFCFEDDKTVHNISVQEIIPESEGARYYCSSNSWTFLSEGLHEFTYTKQHYLTVNSPYGDPQGSGWHYYGSVAKFSVAPTVYRGNWIRHLFLGWSGDSTANMSEATIKMAGAKTVTANWKTQYYLGVNSELGVASGEGWYESGAKAELSVTSPISEGEGRRYVCTGYKADDGPLTSATFVSVTMDAPQNLSWQWKTQYYLKVSSPLGNTTGEGWYDAGSTAQLSVSPSSIPLEGILGFLGVKNIFERWSGALTATTPKAEIRMNSAYTVTAMWRVDYTPLYVEGGLTSVILASAIWLLKWKRSEKEQLAKGLVKYKGQWGTPKEVETWKTQEYEKEQLAKGLVKYEGEWLTPKEMFRREQIAKGFVSFIDRSGVERWGTPKQVEEWKRIKIGLENNFEDYSPQEFQRFVGELFKKMGYSVEIGKYAQDFGIDLVGKKENETIVVEVKKWQIGNNVSNEVVRSVLGAMWKAKANKAVIVTTSGFTVLALEQAKGAPVELWNGDVLRSLVEKYFVQEEAYCGRELEKSVVALERPIEKPTARWYLAPLFLGIMGGLLAYIAVKDQDRSMASNLLFVGIAVTIVEVVVGFVYGFTIGYYLFRR